MSPNLSQKAESGCFKQKRMHQLVNFTVHVEHTVNLNENKKPDKYLTLPVLRKLWNMKMTAVPIIIRALVTVPNSLEKRLKEKIEAIPVTALLKSTRILRRVQHY